MADHTHIEMPGAAQALVGHSGASGFVLPKPSSRENTGNFRYCIARNPRLRKLQKLFKLYRHLSKLFARVQKGNRAMFLLLRVCSKIRGSDIPDSIQTFVDNFFFPDFHAFVTYWQSSFDKRKQCYAQNPKTNEIIARYNRNDKTASERLFLAKIDNYFAGHARRSIPTGEILTTFEVYKRYHPSMRRRKK